MTIKKIFFLFHIIIFLSNERSFAQMAEIPFIVKVKNATDIFEGKVVRKTCFNNTQKSLIYTSNVIEVYKVFKGNITTEEVEIITEGGKIDNEIQESSSGLDLKVGDVGVFMAEPTGVDNPQMKNSKMPFFRAYGSAQGFIKYDLLEKTATDPFAKYNTIDNDVYKAISGQTGETIKIIKPISIDQPKGANSKKKCCWLKCCKKKKL